MTTDNDIINALEFYANGFDDYLHDSITIDAKMLLTLFTAKEQRLQC